MHSHTWTGRFKVISSLGSAVVLLVFSIFLSFNLGREWYEIATWVLAGTVFEVSLWSLVPEVKRDWARSKQVNPDTGKRYAAPWGRIVAMVFLQGYTVFASINFASNMLSAAESDAQAVVQVEQQKTDTASLDDDLKNNQTAIDVQNALILGASQAISKGVVTTSQKTINDAKKEIERLSQARTTLKSEREQKKSAPVARTIEKAQITQTFEQTASVLHKLIPFFPALNGRDLLTLVLFYAFIMLEALFFLSTPAAKVEEDKLKNWFVWEDMEKYIYAAFPIKGSRVLTDDVVATQTGLSKEVIARFKKLLQTTTYDDKPMIIIKQGGTIAQWNRESVLKMAKSHYNTGLYRE